MPARPARTIARRKFGIGRLLRLGGLPEHEVQRVQLAVRHRNPLAGAQVVERLAGQTAVARKCPHGVVHIAIGRAIGQAFAFQAADHRHHIRHVFGRARLMRGAQHAQRVKVGVHGLNHLVGQLPDRDVALQGAADDFVVDVGDIAHIGHPVTRGQQPAIDQVERNHHARMANVAQVVNGDAAHVHAHVAGFDRSKGLNRAGQRVVNAKGHESLGARAAGNAACVERHGCGVARLPCP